MKNKKAILSLLILIVCMTCCCDSHMIEDLRFSSSDITINPYVENDQLSFIDQTGSSLIVTIQSRSRNGGHTYPYHDYDNPNKCKGNYFNSEIDVTDTKSTGPWYFQITLSFDYSFNNPVYDKSIEIDVNHPKANNVSSMTFSLAHFNGDTIFAKYPSFDTVYIYHDSLSLGPRSYFKVYEFVLHFSSLRNDEWATNLYYTIKEGVIGFSTNTGNKWYLLSKQ
jgi:hypothetical protein